MSGIPHWATGPSEVLAHGFELLEEDSDTKRRLAMISIDNAVELAMMTFVSLPKRVSGFDVSRKQRDEYLSNFPSLLDALDNHAADRLVGINLGEIEWFHRLRNELYHQGNGLTVERLKVEAYAQVALELFKALFDVELNYGSSPSGKKLGLFLENWIEIERYLVGQNALNYGRIRDRAHACLKSRDDFSVDDLLEFEDLRALRNAVVHGQADPEKEVTSKVLERIQKLAYKIKDTPF